MKLITSMVLALAFMSAPATIFAVDAPTVATNEVAALPEFDAVVGTDGTLGTVLRDGESIFSIEAPGFEIGPPELVQEGDAADGTHIRVMATPAKAVKVGACHVIITIQNAAGDEVRRDEFIVNVHDVK